MTTDEQTVMSTASRPSQSWEWVAPATGVAFVVLAIVSVVLIGEPKDASDPPEEIVDWYTSNLNEIRIGALLTGLGLALFVFFAAYLRKLLRAAEGEGGMLSLVSFAGAVVIATGGAIDATITLSIAEGADDITPESVQALQALFENDFIPIAVGSVLFLWATGISILRHGALNRWFGWALIVLAIAAATPAGPFAFVGLALWILVTSIYLIVRGNPTAANA